MSATSDPATSHGGTVEPGFEPVQCAFIDGLSGFGGGGGGFAAYIDGHPVVDLWGGVAAPGRPWSEDTTTLLMSSTKGFVTLCAQILYDRGQLDVEAPVAQYWPEFAQAGKEHITVRHVLTHTSGVIGFGEHRPPLAWDGTGWDDYEAIAAGFAASTPSWEPGSAFGYHALSYGWLLGEVVRRISGQSVGTFFRTEVTEPWAIDLRIGTPAADQGRVARITDHMSAGLPLPVRLLIGRVMRALGDPTTMAGQSFVADANGSLFSHAESMFNQAGGLSPEIPAGNGTGSARGLARLYAILAMGGELDGTRLLSPEAVTAFGTQQIQMSDVVMSAVLPRLLRKYGAPPVRRTLGYLINPRLLGGVHTFGPNLDAYGHDGAGGQIAFCDPEHHISVGFVRNDLSSSPKLSNRLIEALYGCVGVVAKPKKAGGHAATVAAA